MGQLHSYNDAEGMIGHEDEFDEAYMRGAYIFKDAAKTIPRDCQKFYLHEGLADNWVTFRVNITAMEMRNKRVGFRLTSAGHVPPEYPTFKPAWTYIDFREPLARTMYRADLVEFADRFGDRLAWIDIPYPFCPSNEPGVAWQTLTDLGGGNEAKGKGLYIDAAKWLIDLYTDLFPGRCIGNLGGPSWAAEILLPYALWKGVNGFRQDSGGRFDWQGNGRVEGENRASMYDQRIAILGGWTPEHENDKPTEEEVQRGRQTFDRLIIEITGNGIVNGKDQSSGEAYPVEQMIGPGGEIEQLHVTDFGNMGVPGTTVAFSELADVYLGAFYDVGGTPGDGGTEPPVDPSDLEARVSALEKTVSVIEDATMQLVIDVARLETWAAKDNFET